MTCRNHHPRSLHQRLHVLAVCLLQRMSSQLTRRPNDAMQMSEGSRKNSLTHQISMRVCQTFHCCLLIFGLV